MKLAIEYLKKEIEQQRDNLRFNKEILKDKSNSPGFNIFYKEDIEKNKKTIQSIEKGIKCLEKENNKLKNELD